MVDSVLDFLVKRPRRGKESEKTKQTRNHHHLLVKNLATKQIPQQEFLLVLQLEEISGKSPV